LLCLGDQRLDVGFARDIGGHRQGRLAAAGYLGGHLVFTKGVMVNRVAWAIGPRRCRGPRLRQLTVSAGDTLVGRGYTEFGDSIETYRVVAEAPRTIQVPAGQFAVLPLVSGGLRLYVSRAAPRRVVKGETPDGTFTFELVHSGPPVTLQTEH